MVNTPLAHHRHVGWMAPAPMWRAVDDSEVTLREVRRPAILGFASDLFMDDLLALMGSCPEALKEWVALPETWRTPAPLPPSLLRLKGIEVSDALDSDGTEPQENGLPLPLKLYQPAHQRFYLAAASLICRKPGLPDSPVDAGRREQATFLLRRLLEPESDREAGDGAAKEAVEHAFVVTAAGPRWRRLESGAEWEVQTDEERLPLSPIGFDADGDLRRRMWVGLIPVSRREAYLTARPENVDSAPPANAATAGPEARLAMAAARDPRVMRFASEVTAPWKALVDQALATAPQTDGTRYLSVQNNFENWDPEATEVENNKSAGVKSAREQIQTISWYILLDLAAFLRNHLAPVWAAILDPSPNEAAKLATLPNDAARAVYERIASISGSGTFRGAVRPQGYVAVPANLRDALRYFEHAWDTDPPGIAIGLESVTDIYDRSAAAGSGGWPVFPFPFADPVEDIREFPCNRQAALPVTEDALHGQIDEFGTLVADALEPLPVNAAPEPALLPVDFADVRDGWFVVRCLFERPNCVPFAPPVVSAPSEPFQMAGFFDSDAPARPVRIPMPVDLTPAGLRKYKKNMGFIFSDQLCGKIKGIRKLTLADLVLSVLPWPFHKDLPEPGGGAPCKDGEDSFGMLCSLSIPIVTLCALILLIIMVTLFDQFLRWLPLLFVCFPIPGMKGKK